LKLFSREVHVKNMRPVEVQEKDKILKFRNGLLTVDYHLKDGSWGIAVSHSVPFRGTGLFAWAEVNGQWVETRGHPVEGWRREDVANSLGEGMRIELLHRIREVPVDVTLAVSIYRRRPSLLLEVSVKNRSGETLRIGKLCPVEIDAARGGGLFLGEGLDRAKFYQDSNNIHGAVVRNLVQAGAEEEAPRVTHQSGWAGLIFNPQSRTSLLGGFLTVQKALGKIEAQYHPKQGIARWSAACQYDGLELGAGEEVRSEKLYLAIGPDPFQALETFADVVAAENDIPLRRETPALWCSWYPYRLKLTEEEVLKNARVIAERFSDYGVRLLQLDYGWNDEDTPGNWSHNKDRFPHGLRWLVEQLQSVGLELGLWIAPFTVFEQSGFFRSHPDCVVRDSRGAPSLWQTPWPWEPKQNIYDLDVRKKEAQEFLSRTFGELTALGIGYFKMDFLNGPSAGPLSFVHGIRNEDRVRDGERMRIGLSLIRKTVGDQVYLLGCNFPHSHGLGLVSAVFGALDVGNAYFGQEESWRHCRRRTSSLIGRYYQQKKFWHLDPDVLYLGGNPPDFSPLPDIGEARLRATAVALSGGPVLLGDNLAQLPEERLAICHLCLPAYGRPARPVDLFSNDHPRVWDLKVETDWGKWDVVGLFNYENRAVVIPVDMADLGLRSERQYLVWEFWRQTLLEGHDHRIEVEIPARDVCLVLIKEVPRRPVLLSTDLHLSQGGVEVSQVEWDGRRRVLRGVCHRRPGTRGALIFYVPDGFAIAECRIAGEEILPCAVASNVWKVEVEFHEKDLRWQIAFHRVT
jgi:alpha-galactosidase